MFICGSTRYIYILKNLSFYIFSKYFTFACSLVKPENMDELVNWVTSEPKEPEESEEKSTQLPSLSNLDVQTIPNKLATYKFPNIACELLTSDCPQITEKLVAEEAYLTKIYSFLEQEGTLNPLLASFFSKVMGLLIARKSELVSIAFYLGLELHL